MPFSRRFLFGDGGFGGGPVQSATHHIEVTASLESSFQITFTYMRFPI